MLCTSFKPFAKISFALFSIWFVTSVSAGPPFGGLYLKPPSSGGLCEGVITIPSHFSALFLLFSRIAKDTSGVGVGLLFSEIATFTPLAQQTLMAVISAGVERACVSLPIKSVPLNCILFLYSQIACVIAITWAWLKLFLKALPLCPDVPKETLCSSLEISGESS